MYVKTSKWVGPPAKSWLTYVWSIIIVGEKIVYLV